jgi:hypothetical protein
VHALIVVAPPDAGGKPGTGDRVSIFPGSATPAMYPAGTPFWIGYGFAAPPGRPASEVSSLDESTRFELDVDGEPVLLTQHVETEGDAVVSKLEIASFPSGLEPGWHRFLGRWYDDGALVLTSDRSIEFVEA